MKKVILVFTGHTVESSLIEFGKSIGAQFRNGFLAEDTKEPCDYVAGHPIPKSYSGVKVHPAWKKFLSEDDEPVEDELVNEVLNGGEKDSEEIEVTAEYLEGLTKKQMLELVDEEELDFTAEQKKNAANLLAALKAHYEV